MTKEVGTLAAIGAKPGDVVAVFNSRHNGTQYTVTENFNNWVAKDIPWWTIISRASDKPKIWRDMTPEEKGALLLAYDEGKVIEWKTLGKKRSTTDGYFPCWSNNVAYRVKPEPKATVVTQYWKTNKRGEFVTMSQGYHDTATHRITFNLIDGEPDCNSVKMEKL